VEISNKYSKKEENTYGGSMNIVVGSMRPKAYCIEMLKIKTHALPNEHTCDILPSTEGRKI